MSMKRNLRAFFLVPLAFIVGAIGAGSSQDATAQAARVQPGASDDLRAAYANAADVADGKRVAERTCAGCHGANGISSVKGVPHLAGQRPAYLYLELKAYQSGARGDSAMGGVVKPLNDEALFKVAAYYASLEPAAAAAGAKSAPAKLDPVQAGKAAAGPCAGCHGEAGISKMPATPSLVGLDPKYLVAAMKGYKSGERKNDIMKSMLAAVTEAGTGADPRRRRRSGGQGCCRRLRRVPWRQGGQWQSGDSEPRGPGRAISRSRAARLQGRDAR
jgi:cytochrome c553